MFQTSVFRKYIRSVDQTAVDAAWARFEAMFLNDEKQQNILNSIEIQYQEGFCRDLFCHVLGYTINPEPGFNLKTEQKNQNISSKFDNRSADAAVILNGNVRVVIELKGCDTLDLSKVENQAFGYKAHQPGCRYVVISNFERLRFYIDTADKYLEFNLFTLTKDEFTKLYLCLALTQIEEDVPARIKADSLTSETEITASFYKDYSAFKRILFNNIVEHNADKFDKLLLFRKTQKLLDRIIFILFCEDRGLLMANTVAKIIKRWGDLKKLDAYQPLYSLFKRHFGYIDAGHKDDEITVFGYNGGLFRTDEVLDALIIDDDVLLGTQKLSNYDFESDVSVDILGHIFEHSLTEIEEIQNQIITENASENSETQETKKTSKRKKDGVFYTPAYITKYIVENTIGRLCVEKKKELGIDEETYAERNHRNTQKEKETKQHMASVLDTYREWLIGLKICDPACGSGAFLNAALQFLQNEHHLIDIYKAHIYGYSLILSDVDTTILENNLYGVDINEESVEIAKLSLWLHTARRGRKLTTLNNNIKCGNSLIDDPAVAGDKAFNWQNEFPEVFEKGGFDVVIGNPPYVLCQPENTPYNILDYYKSEYSVASYKLDLYHLFFEKGIIVLKSNGYMGFITPNTYMTNTYIKTLRQLLVSQTIYSIMLNDKETFMDAYVDPATIIISKTTPEDKHLVHIYKMDSHGNYISNPSTIKQRIWSNNHDLIFVLNNNIKIDSRCQTVSLGDIASVTFGLQTKDKSRYVSNSKGNDAWEPCYTGKDISRWSLNKSSLFFLNIPSEVKAGGSWDMNIHHAPKIVVRQIGGPEPIFAYDRFGYATLNTMYNILIHDHDKFSDYYLLAILSSSLIKYYYLSQFSDNKELFPKIKGGYLKKIPIPIFSLEQQAPLIALTDAQLTANEQLQKYVTKFLNRAQTSLGLTKVTEKIETFYKLDFKGFMDELKKQKIKLSLRDQDDWEEYFDSYREDCTRLLLEIEENDRKIDQLVYALYGLTEEEIRTVEGN